tara:strand:- start:1214 stop:1420 length:207 start_codon:yes stop_codon:yes gene_type:complete
MQLHNAIKELQSRGLQILNTRNGFSRHIIEVAGIAPKHLPVITEKHAGKTRQVRPCKLYGQIVFFIEG